MPAKRVNRHVKHLDVKKGYFQQTLSGISCSPVKRTVFPITWGFIYIPIQGTKVIIIHERN
jgi:hypothetical protein